MLPGVGLSLPLALLLSLTSSPIVAKDIKVGVESAGGSANIFQSVLFSLDPTQL
jgi:hypothetical protein